MMRTRVFCCVVAGLFDEPDDNMLVPRLNACGEERAWVYLRPLLKRQGSFCSSRLTASYAVHELKKIQVLCV